uniref:Protein kinase domain-containing protein n=1 Tax=Panagrolaimus sp. ES5 TaxID=591445 RepID=A0AC34F4A9_9BILA
MYRLIVLAKIESKTLLSNATAIGGPQTASTSKMTLPVFAKKVKKLASLQILNLKLLLNGRGFSKFKKNYKLKGEIGQGGFGIVYSAIRVSDEMPVAVKFIERRHVREWGKLNDERVPMEICMLARCSKIQGVIKLLDWYSMPEGFLIVMERPSPCIDLFDFIRRQNLLTEDLARYLFRQVVHTTIECAERKVLHRDLKVHDFTLDQNGTRLYTGPEWFLHNIYLGKEAAVWSLGVLLYNMVNGRLPFQNEKHICTAHLLGPLPFYTEISESLQDLIRKCLTFDPFSRIALEEILKHEWFETETSDWLELTVNVSLTPSNAPEPIEEESKETNSQDDTKNFPFSNESNNTRKESGVVCGSTSFGDDDTAPGHSNAIHDSHLHEKPDTTIAKVNRTMPVRRNAKTSLLQPVGGNYNGVASSLKKNSSVENKTKSGILRPSLKSRTKHTVESFDSGTSSFACNYSHDSLRSPLGSPLLKNNICQFPALTPFEARV